MSFVGDFSFPLAKIMLFAELHNGLKDKLSKIFHFVTNSK